jgi:DNA invertase Pin-like site-specific DNA recombinase
MMPTPVVAYVRVSRVAGREGDSFLRPELQHESIAGLAKREGLKVVDTLQELDASSGDSSRPLWNQAIQMVDSVRSKGLSGISPGLSLHAART